VCACVRACVCLDGDGRRRRRERGTTAWWCARVCVCAKACMRFVWTEKQRKTVVFIDNANGLKRTIRWCSGKSGGLRRVRPVGVCRLEPRSHAAEKKTKNQEQNKHTHEGIFSSLCCFVASSCLTFRAVASFSLRHFSVSLSLSLSLYHIVQPRGTGRGVPSLLFLRSGLLRGVARRGRGGVG